MANPAVTVDIFGNPAPLNQALGQVRSQLGMFSNSTTAASAGISAMTSSIGGVIGKLAVLGGAYLSVNYAVQQFKAAIDLGGELNDLKARTGQSISDLVVLRQAFQNAGLGAGGVGMAMGRLQKAMGGVNEEGESTNKAFQRLGLSVKELEGMSATEQFAAIGQAVQGMGSQSEKVAAMMGIFGRSGAGMLAIFNDPTAFAVARKQVGGLGETMERNAALFDSLSDAWEAVGNRITQLFAGIAEQVAPTILGMVEAMSQVDFTELGKQIGSVVVAATQLVDVFGPLVVLLTGMAVAQKVVSVVTSFASAIMATIAPITAETAALEANTAAQGRNAAARATKGGSGGAVKKMIFAGFDAAPYSGGAGAAGAAGAGGAAATGTAMGVAAGAAILASAVAIGAGIGYWFQKNVFNWQSSLGVGGASSEADVEAAQGMASSGSLAELMTKSKSLKSQQEADVYQKELADKMRELTKALGELGWNETAQKQVLEGDIAALKRFQEGLESNIPAILANAKSEEDTAKRKQTALDIAEANAALTEGSAQQRFENKVEGAKSSSEKRKILEDERNRQLGILNSEEGGVKAEDRQAAIQKVLSLNQQLQQLQNSDKATAEQNKEKAAAMEAQLAMNEAVAYGNEAEKERVQWMEAYTAALKEAKAVNMENPEEFAKKTANAATQADRDAKAQAKKDKEEQDAKDKADKDRARGSVELQLQKEEAAAAGNTALADKLQQQQDYNAALEEGAANGMNEAEAQEYAQRKIAAKALQAKRDAASSKGNASGDAAVSSIQQIGGGGYSPAAVATVANKFSGGLLGGATPFVSPTGAIGTTPSFGYDGTTAKIEGVDAKGGSASVVTELQRQTTLLEQITALLRQSPSQPTQTTGGRGFALYKV